MERTKKKKSKNKNKSKRNNLFIFKYLLLASLCLSIVLFYVWERVELLEAGYKIRKGEERKQKLIEEREILLLGAARFKSPQRLERIAKEEIGLITPRPGKSIRTIYSTRKLKPKEHTEKKQENQISSVLSVVNFFKGFYGK